MGKSAVREARGKSPRAFRFTRVADLLSIAFLRRVQRRRRLFEEIRTMLFRGLHISFGQ